MTLAGLRLAQERRILGVFVNETINMTQQCMACFKVNLIIRLSEVILTVFSALVRSHLESCIQFWDPQHKKDVDRLE